MRRILLLVGIGLSLTTMPLVGNAHGCVKGAAAGGVVGHVAGHHAVAGAAVGCVVGHHRAKVKEKQAAEATAKPAPPRAMP